MSDEISRLRTEISAQSRQIIESNSATQILREKLQKSEECVVKNAEIDRLKAELVELKENYERDDVEAEQKISMLANQIEDLDSLLDVSNVVNFKNSVTIDFSNILY